VLVVCGTSDGEMFAEWTSYPQVPLSAGANFAVSEQNVLCYTVTINGALYKVQVTLGDLP
jgi:hypothetical protein